MSTRPQGRILSKRFAEDVADFMNSKGIDLKPGKDQTGSLTGLDGWHLRLSRTYRIKLSEYIDQAEFDAKDRGIEHTAVIQYRSGEPLERQYVIMSLMGLTRLLGATG